jgi:hypothetical protein
MRKAMLAVALGCAGIAGAASAQTVVSADVTTNTTWGGAANPSPIILQQPIFVKNGAILTILPGTIVRGQPRTQTQVPGVVTGTPGALIITQSGRLVAEGSASNPIIMTTAAVDNNNDGVADDDNADFFEDEWVPGDVFLDDTPRTAPLAPLNRAGASNVALWGGLVILGSAPTNLAEKCGTGYGTCTIEGLTVPGFPPADALYGGNLPHDNSGSLKYVSIRHAGDEIGNSNELNGLTLGGVGDGTTIENVEVYANFDDGIEWFGGTVGGKRLHVAFVGDDMYDADEGYTGVNQFLFGIMPFFNENGGAPFGSASGDKAAEFDGDNYRPDNVAHNDNVNVRINIQNTVVDPTPRPLSYPVFYNITAIGSTPDSGQDFAPASAASTNRGLQFRNGFAGEVHNSIVVNTGAETGIEVDTGVGGAPGFNATQNGTNGFLSLVCSTLDDGAALASQETTVVNNGNAINTALGGSSAGQNVVNSVSFNGLVKEDQTFDPRGNASGKLDASLKVSPINPRPATGLVGLAGCVAPSGPGLDRVTFRGAFDRTASTLWTTGWTVLNAAGLLAN